MLPLLVESTLPVLSLRALSGYAPEKRTSTAVTCVPYRLASFVVFGEPAPIPSEQAA
ncbi:hypothetical protein PISMIDRAFT_689362 [Pisolithus microcarpus 441]|uniref:Uncharacterized protein n=1 Tax=Pisolithus microcarpus 441 TaxID=765257 RepID=A0A0C9XJV2_9AGAM|nr:hypothetical protein PISMIDRAFT_689362 [Pisolithus microcarpus 441]